MFLLFIWKSNLFFNANLKYSLANKTALFFGMRVHGMMTISLREYYDIYFTNDLKSCFLSAAIKYEVDSDIVFRTHDGICACNST